jgi:hypothetical protein
MRLPTRRRRKISRSETRNDRCAERKRVGFDLRGVLATRICERVAADLDWFRSPERVSEDQREDESHDEGG